MSGDVGLPSRWRRGDPLEARKLNESVDAVRRQIQGARAIQQNRPGAAATVAEVRQFKVQSIEHDHLVCVPWDGTAEGVGLVYVAKPPTLRASIITRGSLTFSAVSTSGQSRTATLGSDTETQVVIPTYVAGDIIYALRNVRGGVDVARDVAGVDTPLDWLDLNVDGRQWAKEAE